jgi:zinc protease
MDALDYQRMNISTSGPTTRPTHEFTLANGLKVIVREDHRKPEFYSTLSFSVGESYERPEEWGLTQLLRSALFDNLKPEAALVKKAGGEASFPIDDIPLIRVRLPREHLGMALKLQSLSMKTELEDEVIHRNLKRLISHSKEKSLHVSAICFSPEIEALIEKGTSYYRPPEGITANLERLTVEQLKRWRKTWFGPSTAVLSITGDITPGEAKRFAEEHFASIAKCDVANRPIILGPPAPGYRQITQHLEIEHALMVFAFNTPSITTAADYQTVRALHVIGALLSESSPAHLGEVPASTVSNVYQYRRGDARLSFAYGFDGDPDEMEVRFWDSLENLRCMPPSQADLEQAINTLSVEKESLFDNIEAQSEVIARLVSIGAPWHLLDLEVAQLKSVTPSDVQKAAYTYLTRERVTVGRIFPATRENSDAKE